MQTLCVLRSNETGTQRVHAMLVHIAQQGCARQVLAGLTPRLCAETSGPTQNPGTRPRPPRGGEHAQCREGGAGFTGRGGAGQGSPAHP